MTVELFAKIKADDLAEKVYIRLKRAITQNIIPMGERIDINLLMQQWGVSRTPLKDAITRLEAERLIVVKPKIGTFTSEITETDMLELIDIRLLLEGGISREVVAHAGEAQLRELTKNLELLEAELAKGSASFDYFQFNQLDAAFHDLIVSCAGNHHLTRLYRSLNFHNQISRYYHNKYEERMEQTRREHSEIVAAIAAGDVLRLESVLKRHILSGKDRLQGRSGT